MKHFKTVFQDTVRGGIFFLLPLFVLIMIGEKVWAYFSDFGANIVKSLGFPNLVGVASSSIIVAILILLVCYLFGLLSKRSRASTMRDNLESSIVSIFPMYDYYKALFLQKYHLQKTTPRPAVFIEIEGATQPAILIEENSDGTVTLFVPFSPKITDGRVFIVKKEATRDAGFDEKQLNKYLLKQGKGVALQTAP